MITEAFDVAYFLVFATEEEARHNVVCPEAISVDDDDSS